MKTRTLVAPDRRIISYGLQCISMSSARQVTMWCTGCGRKK